MTREMFSDDEETKQADIFDQDNYPTPPNFWRASVNAVKAADLAESATFQDALNGSEVHWRNAVETELKPMCLCGVFRAEKLPSGQGAIGTKWVFKIKRKADESVEKNKAALLLKGASRSMGDIVMIN